MLQLAIAIFIVCPNVDAVYAALFCNTIVARFLVARLPRSRQWKCGHHAVQQPWQLDAWIFRQHHVHCVRPDDIVILLTGTLQENSSSLPCTASSWRCVRSQDQLHIVISSIGYHAGCAYKHEEQDISRGDVCTHASQNCAVVCMCTVMMV